MKKQLLSFVALGLLFVTASASAQTVKIKADIPFDFVVNQQLLPKGEYTVESFGTPSSGTLVLRSADHTAKSMLIGHACETPIPPANAKLVFHHYGEQYFLAQVWSVGDTSGRELAKGRREAQMAKAATEENVSIAALQ